MKGEIMKDLVRVVLCLIFFPKKASLTLKGARRGGGHPHAQYLLCQFYLDGDIELTFGDF